MIFTVLLNLATNYSTMEECVLTLIRETIKNQDDSEIVLYYHDTSDMDGGSITVTIGRSRIELFKPLKSFDRIDALFQHKRSTHDGFKWFGVVTSSV